MDDTRINIFLALCGVAFVTLMVWAFWHMFKPQCLEERWNGGDWQCTRMSDEPRRALDCTVRYRTENGKWECKDL